MKKKTKSSAKSKKERKSEAATKGKNLKGKKIEEVAVSLAEQGKSPSEIGIVLRDTYGVGNVKNETGKKLVALLSEKNLTGSLPIDLQNLINKAKIIRSHLESHPKDKEAKYGLRNIESRLRKLAKYYKKRGDIPFNWRY